MSDFEELLRKSVAVVSKAYSAAEKDMFDEISGATDAIQKVTKGRATLQLQKVDRDAVGSVFTMYIATPEDVFEIATFSISPNGYPVKVASKEEYLGMGLFDAVLNSKQEIHEYFIKALSEPDSRLVLRVSFLMRQ